MKKFSRKQIARNLVKWFENTTLSPQIIFKHYGIPKQQQVEILPSLLEARQAKWKAWTSKEDAQ